MRKMYIWFLEKYAKENLEVLKKSRILLTVNLVIGIFAIVLGLIMLMTGAFAVFITVMILALSCGVTLALIRAGKYRFAVNYFLTFLFFVMFAAIKFDEYKSIYETYVFSTLGLFLLVTGSLVGYRKRQMIVYMILVLIAIWALYLLDTYPQNGYQFTLLDIQSLATSQLMVILGGVFCGNILSLQKLLIDKAEEETTATKKRFETLGNIVMSAQKSGLDIGERLTDSSSRTIEMTSKVSEYLDNIQVKITQLNDSVNRSSDANRNVVTANSQVDEYINQYRNSVEQVTAALEQIVSSIHSISENAETKKGAILTLVERAEDGEKKIRLSEASIEKVSKSSGNILDLIQVIADITERTNILALNAAIEASHAGSAGKGFAVVASEIRKLAEETGKNSKLISETVKKSEQAISESTGVNADAADAFIKINQEIKDVASLIQEVIVGIKEMSVGTNDIINAVGKIESMSNSVGDSISNASQMIGQSTGGIQDIQNLTQMILEDVKTIVAELFSDMNREAQGVNRISKENLEHINHLYQDIKSVGETKVM